MTKTSLMMKKPPATTASKPKAMKPLPGAANFKFGCDPELFVVDPDGRYVSAAGLIPGTKAEPHKVEYGAVQVDGMAAEFNIDPVTTFEDWNRNIKAVMGKLESMLPKGYKLVAKPAVRFDKEVFDAAPEGAKELGCMPDFNAWTGEMNPPPRLPEDPYLRTASGHIHVGWTEDTDVTDLQHIVNCRDFGQQADWFLGAWSVTKDTDKIRRSLYGKAGAIRFKPYGVEYRVLSNFWISEKALRLEVWNRLQLAIRDMKNLFMPERYANYSNSIQEAINAGRLPSAFKAMSYPVMSIAADPFSK